MATTIQNISAEHCANGIGGINGATNCGLQFLDSSVPRLIRHADSPDIPAGLASQVPAGKGSKLSQGAGQSPAESRVSRAASTSLDEVQINRDRPAGWKKNCGMFSVRGLNVKEPGKSRFCRVGCKCWNCSGCGPRRASMYCIRIRKMAERLKLNKLLTLTLDPAKLQGQESTHYINEVFADFRIYLKRKLGRAPSYIRVLEYQKNGNAHLHILVRDWLDARWVSEAWGAVGGGRIVDIRFIDMHRVSRYLSKYLTKHMIAEAPARARRVTTSRDIKLLAKEPSDYAWNMLRCPILRVYDHCKTHGIDVTALTPDADGCILSFEITGEPDF